MEVTSEFVARTIIEPFQIKAVEPLRLLSRANRLQAAERAHFNLFKLSSRDVTIDLLTDSGTSAMSSEQWAAMQRGDESYAGSRSFDELQKAVHDLTGLPHVLPTHQGRAAERILFSILAGQVKSPSELTIPNNSHFDTTRANIEAVGIQALDFPCGEFFEMESDFRFKGNMNLKSLEEFLKKTPAKQIPVGMITLTNNTCGGQPVSFENIRSVRDLYKSYRIPFFIDACRFAENAAFIHQYELPQRSPESIAKEVFSWCDGVLFSGKKDALVNIGGFLAFRDSTLLEELKGLLILTEGFPTYGGLAGRDLGAMAQGLKEILDPDYLRYRLAVTEYMGRRLDQRRIPWLRPAGGHAIYLDAKRFCSHLQWKDYPGQALAVALYLEGGIRSCEIGSLMFGRQSDSSERAHQTELVRLAIPRRVYTQSHMDYVLEAIEYVFERRSKIKAVRILREPPRLRHFSADFTLETR